MKQNYCTLFNSEYLAKGLAMFSSLQTHSLDFHLYIFAFDEPCFRFFKTKNYENITVISLAEFEDDELLRVKETRTAGEYCWTCTPSTILFCLEKFDLAHCTYVDADILFYNDPKILTDEIKNNSVMITEHRYTCEYDQSEVSGKYCVQFITFKNNTSGMKVLKWWRSACIEWCHARVEDGKFGDQKYLDDWTSRFESVHVMENLAGGIAPWNVQQYYFSRKGNSIYGAEKKTGKKFGAVFYHFHGVKIYNNGIVQYSDELYELNRDVKKIFYTPYIGKLKIAEAEIRITEPDAALHSVMTDSPKQPMNVILYITLAIHDAGIVIKNIFGRKYLSRLKHYHYHRSRMHKS